MSRVETSRAKIVSRLTREGWELVRRGAAHDIFGHPVKGVVAVPRHRVLSPGVARSIAKVARWL